MLSQILKLECWIYCGTIFIQQPDWLVFFHKLKFRMNAKSITRCSFPLFSFSERFPHSPFHDVFWSNLKVTFCWCILTCLMTFTWKIILSFLNQVEIVIKAWFATSETFCSAIFTLLIHSVCNSTFHLQIDFGYRSDDCIKYPCTIQIFVGRADCNYVHSFSDVRWVMSSRRWYKLISCISSYLKLL